MTEIRKSYIVWVFNPHNNDRRAVAETSYPPTWDEIRLALADEPDGTVVSVEQVWVKRDG